MAAFRWDDGLRGHPRRIAALDQSPLRVLAGPGTGKTFALMRRVARLLQEGADPKRILVCTFTRTAARDLQNELANLGVAGADNVVAGTLHAFCFGLLSRSEVLPLTGRAPRPLLDYEQAFLVADLRERVFGGIREKRRRLRAFSADWARLQADDPGWPSDPVDQRFHRALISWLRFHGAMLIGELVPEALRFLRENPASPHHTAFEHVLVDEYQDLNRSEQVILDMLASAGTLTVIGDENQSIYSFKHAHPEGISTFDQSHPGTHDEDLAICRRCPKDVVRMANSLISFNANRMARGLRPRHTNPDGDIHVVQWRSLQEETDGIAEYVRKSVKSGDVAAGNVLILSPRRHFGYAIRDALNILDVPAHSFFYEEALDGDPKDAGKSSAQQTFALLSLLANPADTVALRCWCGFGSSSLRSGAWQRLRTHCEEVGDEAKTAFEELARGRLTLPYTSSLASRYRVLKRRLSDLASLKGEDLVDCLFPADEDWADPYRALAEGIDEEDFDAEKLRDALRIGITQPELPTDVDYIRVMSLHKSKGLTADMVIVVGCMEGLIPFINQQLPLAEQDRSLEEQRRLFYVALTRTRATLVLSGVASLPRDLAWRIGANVRGGSTTHANTIASRFLGELGPARPSIVLGASLA